MIFPIIDTPINYSQTTYRLKTELVLEDNRNNTETLFNKSQKKVKDIYSNEGATTSVYEGGNKDKDNIKDNYVSIETNKHQAYKEGYSNAYYSDKYIEYNTEKMMGELIDNFNSWALNGTENSYHKIVHIKQVTNLYSHYLANRDENRIFISIIELLFDNNSWEKLNSGQLRFFVNELKRFEDGNITWNKLGVFSKQVKRMKLSLLKTDVKETSN